MEQSCSRLRRDANARIRDPKAYEHVMRGCFEARGTDHDSTRFGEFYGIAYEVDEDLSQPTRVARDPGWQRGMCHVSQCQPLPTGLPGKQLEDVLHGRVQLKVTDLKPHFVGLEL